MSNKNKRLRELLVGSAATAVVVTSLAPMASAATDVKADSRYYDAVNFLATKDVKGFKDGTFKPHQKITRIEAAEMLVKVLELDTKAAPASGFTDVPQRAAKYVNALKHAGITKGKTTTTFASHQPITRGELAIWIEKAFDLKDPGVKLAFDDVSERYVDAVKRLIANAVTEGKTADKFGTTVSATRGEYALFLQRAFKVKESVDVTLSLMHTNDTHANLEKIANRVTAVNEVRAEKPDALLVDAGDVFSGTLYFNEFKGQADLEFMNIMGYDVMTFGNHEFDLGSSPEGHKALADFIKAAKFPFVSSNVNFSKDPSLQGLFSDLISSKPENGKIYNGIVKEINGQKVGFFGLTTAETADIASPGEVKFEDYLKEAEKAVKAFEDMGINKIVAVTHIGYDDDAAIDNDLELAAKVDGIDVIIGGHSHTRLEKPVVINKDENGAAKNTTLIVQAYQYNEYLGTLDVQFDDKGDIINYEGELLKVADYKEDAKAAEALKKYSDKIKEIKETETGAIAEFELKNPRQSDENSDGSSVRANETALGNLITDGMLAKAKQYDANIIMALQNGGGIRAAINKGPITVGEVIAVLPFGNTLATMKLTGAELKEAFEISLGSLPKENGGFLHVSGAKVTYDSSKAKGNRVVSVEYKNTDGSYTKIEDAKSYTIATNAFTAKGGDGYDVFKKAYEQGRVKDLGLSDWENLRDHVVSLKNVAPKVEGRIVEVSASAPVKLEIYEIQGASHKSPYEGRNVTDVEGIVTYVDGANKFYMQSQNPDNDVKTSDGIEVYMKDHGVKVGDVVAVNGTVKEYRSSIRTNDLTTTQIEGTSIEKLKENQTLPKPVILDVDRKIPTDSIDSDGLTVFNPEKDAIDYYESLEGMLVQVNKPKIVSPVSYNDLIVIPETMNATNDFGGLAITSTDYNPERITLNLNDKNLQADAGDWIDGNVVGTVAYDFGNYVIQTKKEDLPKIEKSGKSVMTDVTTIEKEENKMTVAAYNLENFAVGDKRVTDIGKSIANNLKSPDIVELSEVQDDSGSNDDGVVSAAKSYQAIIDAIRAAGGPTYAYVEVAPENNQDGGAPGGNIRVGMLYNTERVALLEGAKAGTAKEAVEYKDERLTLNPGRINPTSEAFTKSRKPVAAQFTFKPTGEEVIVIAAHYNSKGGDHQLFGDVQPPVLSSEVQRNKIAKVVNDFVADVHNQKPNANVIVAGDLNDFEFSQPLKITAGSVLTNMIDKVPAGDRFTYMYQGNSQVLDHILISNRLADSAKVDIVHINSPFTAQISDHDPVLVQVDLSAAK